MNKYIVMLFLMIIEFTIGETIIVVAESSQLDDFVRNNSILISPDTADNKLANLGDKRIILTWLETNETEADSIQNMNISSQEFWNAFNSLLEISINRTIDTSK